MFRFLRRSILLLHKEHAKHTRESSDLQSHQSDRPQTNRKPSLLLDTPRVTAELLQRNVGCSLKPRAYSFLEQRSGKAPLRKKQVRELPRIHSNQLLWRLPLGTTDTFQLTIYFYTTVLRIRRHLSHLAARIFKHQDPFKTTDKPALMAYFKPGILLLETKFPLFQRCLCSTVSQAKKIQPDSKQNQMEENVDWTNHKRNLLLFYCCSLN